ncbi:MAG: DNA polymerase III subunit gamma/tau [Treponema sp.]|nr:DNA polymerase III subunit gamma/tau [Treponema sp.]
MSYEVTATRRRPQQFDHLIGQEFVAETLKNSIKSGKIAHAYLFSGPRGCGKTSTARILAKALNCQHGPTDTPCGQCSNCQEITKGSSLDVIEIDGASNTSVENIRQIKDEVLFPPSNSKYKIYIIDEVHMLSTSAFNALLKTIEEPPPYVIFIFATTELQKVPATIKSRCQQYNFRLVPVDKVKQCLAEAAAELNVKADDEALFWIARESTGSMRDAYTLFDQVVAFSDGEMTYEKIRDKLGLVGLERLNTLFEACSASKTEEVLSMLDEFLQSGISIEQLITNCADYLRSLLLIKNGVKKEALLGNSPERFSSAVLSAWNTVQIERALSIYLQLYRDIRYSLSPRYELELAFSRLCWLGQYVSSAEVKKAIDAAQALLNGAPLAPQASAAAQLPHSQQAQPVVQPQAQSLGQQAPLSQPAPAASAASGLQVPVPDGLPQLSMLNCMPDEEGEEEDNSPDGENPENTSPFYDGGPLPPEQSVESEAQVQEASGEPIDERLKIHLPQLENAAGNDTPAPSIVVPESDIGYTENPDEEWSNMDAPPDDEEYYPSDEERAYQAEKELESFNSNSGESRAQAPVQLEESLTTADGRKISIAQLRGSVMAALSVSDGFAATNLETTGLWKVKENCVETSVSDSYSLELIKRKQSVIAQEISKVCGRPMEFSVILENKAAPVQVEKVTLPLQVEILLNLFNGTIVAGKH